MIFQGPPGLDGMKVSITFDKSGLFFFKILKSIFFSSQGGQGEPGSKGDRGDPGLPVCTIYFP